MKIEVTKENIEEIERIRGGGLAKEPWETWCHGSCPSSSMALLLASSGTRLNYFLFYPGPFYLFLFPGFCFPELFYGKLVTPPIWKHVFKSINIAPGGCSFQKHFPPPVSLLGIGFLLFLYVVVLKNLLGLWLMLNSMEIKILGICIKVLKSLSSMKTIIILLKLVLFSYCFELLSPEFVLETPKCCRETVFKNAPPNTRETTVFCCCQAHPFEGFQIGIHYRTSMAPLETFSL